MTYRLRVPKDYSEAVNEALRAGWTLSQGRTAHPKITSPDGRYAFPIPTSSHNPFMVKGFISRLRKAMRAGDRRG